MFVEKYNVNGFCYRDKNVNSTTKYINKLECFSSLSNNGELYNSETATNVLGFLVSLTGSGVA